MTSIADVHSITHALAQEVLNLIPDAFSTDIDLKGAQKKHEELRLEAKNFLGLYEFAGPARQDVRTTKLTADEAGLLVHWVDNLIQFKLQSMQHADKVLNLEDPAQQPEKVFHQEVCKILNTTIDRMTNNLKAVFTNFGNLNQDYTEQFKPAMQAVYTKVQELVLKTGVPMRDLGVTKFGSVFGISKK